MQLIAMLNYFEAVTSGDVMIIQLPANRVWDIDGKRVASPYGKGTQVSVAKDAVISTVTSAQRVLKHYVNGDSEISSELMNEYRADFDYGDNYPDLETEFQHRKLLADLGKYTPVYEKTPEVLIPIEYRVIGEFTDTGSDYIETALTYGKGRFYNNEMSFFKLNVTGLLGNELQRFAKEKGLTFSNSTHSGYRYAQINGLYVSEKAWETRLQEGSTQYHPTLTSAKKAEQTLVGELRQMLNAKFNYSKLDGLLINEIYGDLQRIKGYVQELEVKVKSDNTKRLAIRAIDELQIKLGENK
jgi:hypothetical protein